MCENKNEILDSIRVREFLAELIEWKVFKNGWFSSLG
jgi:hypothetical protein